MNRYSGMSGRVRDLMRRIRSWFGGRDPPIGSAAWEATLEVQKLPAIIEDRMRQLRRGNLTGDQADAITRELDSLESQLRNYERMVARVDSNPGRGFVAAEGVDDLRRTKARLEERVSNTRSKIGNLQAKARRLNREADRLYDKSFEPGLSRTQKRKRQREAAARRDALEARNQANRLRSRDLREQQQQLNAVTNQVEPQRRALTPIPCFSADTMVWTPDGPRRIDQLRRGDFVLSYDFETQNVVERRVDELLINRTTHFYVIEAGGEQIRATGRHPFWVASLQKWVQASYIRPGMVLQDTGGNSMVVTTVSLAQDIEAPSYNLDVDEIPNYFVGAGVLVHNADPPVDVGLGGRYIVYRGTNPAFGGDSAYIGITRLGANERLEDHIKKIERELRRAEAGEITLTERQRRVRNFRRGMSMEVLVAGIHTEELAEFLEQHNMDLTREEGKSLMNDRQQMRPERRTQVTESLRNDPKFSSVVIVRVTDLPVIGLFRSVRYTRAEDILRTACDNGCGSPRQLDWRIVAVDKRTTGIDADGLVIACRHIHLIAVHEIEIHGRADSSSVFASNRIQVSKLGEQVTVESTIDHRAFVNDVANHIKAELVPSWR